MDPTPGLDQAVEALIAARGDDAKDPSPLVSRAALNKLIAPLTQAYWDKTTQILSEAVQRGGDQLILNKYERLTIDLGMLDSRLVPDFNERRVELLKELYAQADPTHFYFSEWLAHRYRTFTLTDRMEAVAAAAAAAPAAADAETQQFLLVRSRLYSMLRGFFESLPGFPAATVEMLFNGKIDSMIADLTAALARKADTRQADQRQHLVTMRQRMIARARERATTPEELTYFDGLAKIDALLEAKAQKAAEEGRAAPEARPKPAARADTKDPAKRTGFVNAELTLVKSLLRLGVMGAGITRTTPVLFSAAGRTRRTELRDALERVRECDPALPGSPNMLVAPYVGTGFYEWDRDTIFVPLTPTRGVDEAIVTALANYRIMLDNLQGKGGLKRAYEAKFPKEDFRAGFLRDYKNWVLGVGKGFKGALTQESYDFFKDYIGPQAQDLFAPAEMARLSPEQRNEVIKQCRGRLNRGEGTYHDHWHLGIMYWRENQPPQALENIAAAVKLYPVDGRLLYTLGHVCAAVGYDAKAREAFDEVLSIAPNTIWHVYASDALQKLG
jgi:tetratricopeptide (TPR) repeat protein